MPAKCEVVYDPKTSKKGGKFGRRTIGIIIKPDDISVIEGPSIYDKLKPVEKLPPIPVPPTGHNVKTV